MAEVFRVFVYGSLLRGESNHYLLAEARFLGETATAPGLALVDLGEYPGMVKEGSDSVAGELYEVDERTLAALDRLERHPEVYWRTRVRLVNRQPVEAYLLRAEQAEGRPRVPFGDWRRR